MKVAFISNTKGGLGTYTQYLVNDLSKSVESIDVYLIEKPNFELKFPDNVNIIVMSNNIYTSFLKSFFYIRKFGGYDVVHTNYGIFGLAPYLAKKVYHKPYLYEAHGYPQYWMERSLPAKIAYYLEYKFAPIVARAADKFVTVSEYNRKLFLDRHHVDSEVIYHGVDVDVFKYDKPARIQIRKSLGVDNKTDIVLYAGYLTPVKDPLTFVNSIPFVLDVFPDTKFLIKGGGILYSEVVARVKELGVENSVIMNAYSKDMVGYYSASDLFVIPSLNEMFGWVTAEALACGLPVIGSNSGGTPEVLGDDGLMFNVGDSEGLAEKIVYLLGHKDVMKTMREEGPKRVKRLFNSKSCALKYVKLYKSMTENKSRDN